MNKEIHRLIHKRLAKIRFECFDIVGQCTKGKSPKERLEVGMLRRNKEMNQIRNDWDNRSGR